MAQTGNGMKGAFCATLIAAAIINLGCEAGNGPSCGSGRQDCNGSIADGCETDTTGDVNNCGGCGIGCAAAQICAQGKCQAPVDASTTPADLTAQTPADFAIVCPMGETVCAGICKDTKTDAFHCGGCGQACFMSQTCEMGKCVSPMGVDAGPLKCPDGHGDCDGNQANACETDLNASDSNCAACGTACDVVNGQKCSQGICAIPADMAKDPADMSQLPDLATNPDLATSPDLTKSADGGMAATDGTNPNDLASPPNDQAQAPACDPNQGLKNCGGPICTDISKDGKNCNGCNNTCPQGSVCSNFSCVPACKPGETGCNGSCTDLMTDGQHCGGCNTPCAVNSVCVSGKCEVGGCPQGLTTCGIRACVNLLSDQFNCGGCNKACANNEVCEQGKCVFGLCQQSQGDCDNDPKHTCETNTNTNINHCGACGHACKMKQAMPFCSGGSCRVAFCFGDWLNCNNDPDDDCEVNGATDVTHCGWCGNSCPAVPNGTRACSDGTCGIGTCFGGFADCNKVAKDGCEVNTTSDVSNCGACAKVCKTSNGTPACSGGVCEVKKCNFGWDDCNGSALDGCEINVGNDPKNCGGCGNTCSLGQTCVFGVCSGVGNCGGLTLCNNACVNTNTDTANCGGCGKVCAQGQACQVGQCVAVCGMGLTLCNGGCVNTSIDPAHCGGCGKACNQGQTCVNSVCQAMGGGNLTGTIVGKCLDNNGQPLASCEMHLFYQFDVGDPGKSNTSILNTPLSITLTQVQGSAFFAWGPDRVDPTKATGATGVEYKCRDKASGKWFDDPGAPTMAANCQVFLNGSNSRYGFVKSANPYGNAGGNGFIYKVDLLP